MSSRRTFIIAAVLLATLAHTAPGAAATTDPEAEWILESQLPDGAIAQYPDFTRINPYLANYAALGLVRAWGKTGNTAYVDAAAAWFAWYESHMDGDGYVTDYDLGPAPAYVETSTGDFDSTDGYAGTLLLALYELKRQGPAGKLRLAAHHTLVSKAVGAVLSTQQADGLTWAKPSYQVKFLMDQSEAFGGLRAAARMAPIYHDSVLGRRVRLASKAMHTGVATLWDASAGLYRYAKESDDTLKPTTWSYFYPDATSEAFAVGVGCFLSPSKLIPAARAKAIMATFTASWPQWTQPDATVPFDSGPGVVNYWPLIGGALFAVHRKVEAAAAVQAIEAFALSTGRAYPFVVASAGQLVRVSSP